LAALTKDANPTAKAFGIVDQGAGLATSNGFVQFQNADANPPGKIDPGNVFAGLQMSGLMVDAITVTGAQLPLPNTARIPTGQTTASYAAGVVCFNPAGVETDYWSVPVTFKAVQTGTASGQDPDGFVWTPGTSSGTTTTSTSSSTTSSTSSTSTST